MTRVTAVLAHSSGELLLLGTEGGHVFVVEVPGFRELEENNISVDDVQNRSDITLVRLMNSCKAKRTIFFFSNMYYSL